MISSFSSRALASAVCARDWTSGEIIHATVADLPTLETSCDLAAPRAAVRIGGAIRGLPAGTPVDVYVGLPGEPVQATTNDAVTSYEALVPPGSYDVTAIASGTPARALIHRNVAVSAGAAVDLDFASDGRALVEQPITVTGATGPVSIGVELRLGAAGYLGWAAPKMASYPALAERDLGPGDTQQLSVFTL